MRPFPSDTGVTARSTRSIRKIWSHAASTRGRLEDQSIPGPRPVRLGVLAAVAELLQGGEVLLLGQDQGVSSRSLVRRARLRHFHTEHEN